MRPSRNQGLWQSGEMVPAGQVLQTQPLAGFGWQWRIGEFPNLIQPSGPSTDGPEAPRSRLRPAAYAIRFLPAPISNDIPES
ncbi:hypothetical protein ElP_54710 [Tautonia plasticadhaerens]|uniref:Uncharacterized protein n=1 Tax=Tautonia plasticadhaerens TaxID=2527974 RepID=A0A518H9L2_9BACT|nr:hypothetical protein ElP_54710 [Tautonia plasticadhaerens]